MIFSPLSKKITNTSVFFSREASMRSEKREKEERKSKKMKTPVYDGEEGKISPSCPIWEPTLGVSMLLGKAALRRLILPAVLRELFLTGCALKPAVLAHCEESCCCSWSHVSTAVEVAWPKSDLLIRLATQRECCVTSTSMRCLVFSGLRLFFRNIAGMLPEFQRKIRKGKIQNW